MGWHTYLQIIGIEACLDSMNEPLIGNANGQHRRLEDLHLEPVLILPKPLDSKASISVPTSESFKLLCVNVVQSPNAKGDCKKANMVCRQEHIPACVLIDIALAFSGLFLHEVKATRQFVPYKTVSYIVKNDSAYSTALEPFPLSVTAHSFLAFTPW